MNLVVWWLRETPSNNIYVVFFVCYFYCILLYLLRYRALSLQWRYFTAIICKSKNMYFRHINFAISEKLANFGKRNNIQLKLLYSISISHYAVMQRHGLTRVIKWYQSRLLQLKYATTWSRTQVVAFKCERTKPGQN